MQKVENPEGKKKKEKKRKLSEGGSQLGGKRMRRGKTFQITGGVEAP